MITKIFCDIDDFMKIFEKNYKKQLLENCDKPSKMNSKLSMSEIMTILVFFHGYGNRTFKDFYMKTICKNFRSEFPNLVSYNRFVELIPTVLFPLIVFLKTQRLIKSDKITFIDSTKIAVCHNKRIPNHRTFDGIANRGKSSMGWFFGFKLHITVNEKGELAGVYVSEGSTDDRNPNVIDSLLENVSGKLFGDKGYISKDLFSNLYEQGIVLVTSIRKNMKNKLVSLVDKLLLRKRSVIETINDQLKNICDIEHTRHRSPVNFMVNMIAGLIRYTYFEKKPSINFTPKQRNMLESALLENHNNTDYKSLVLF